MSFLKDFDHLRIPFQDIQVATENFTTIIGQGGYGPVYKGKLTISGNLTCVAVKRLLQNIDESGQGLKEFLTEINLLSRHKHPNLVSLLGFCHEGHEKILIYEYAEHGSFDNYLNKANPLTWRQRLNICVNAARGLDYLHNRLGANHRIIHRDIKSGNILLDENFRAMIADFGLSKIGRTNVGDSFLITMVGGTLGYVDPVYMNTGVLSKKSDVYSFGVVLFEALCARLCFMNVIGEQRNLAYLARRCYKEGKLRLIMDPELKDAESTNEFSSIAYQCLHDEQEARPSMDVVLQKLVKALVAHEFEEAYDLQEFMEALVLQEVLEAMKMQLTEELEETCKLQEFVEVLVLQEVLEAMKLQELEETSELQEFVEALVLQEVLEAMEAMELRMDYGTIKAIHMISDTHRPNNTTIEEIYTKLSSGILLDDRKVADAPGRGCISSFTPPVRETDLLEAEAMQTLVLLNSVTYPRDPVHDILYRSFDREYDITHHVFRWDTTPYQQVFANGFHARRQEHVSDEVYCNLEQYVNRGGRPLDSTQPAPHCFVSTTLNSGWYPSVRTDQQGELEVTRYEIYAPGGIWVAETLGDRYRFHAQDEVAFVNGIAPQYIRSAQLFRLQASGRHTRRERVDHILYINGGFNPQLFYADERMPEIQRPIKLYQNPTTKKMENLILQIWNPPHMRRKRETNIRYVNYKALVDDGILINAAFRSSQKDKVYVFMKNEYALINYAPRSTNDRVVNGPHLICDSFPSLSGTAFGEYGIDCAFTTHYPNECFIFSAFTTHYPNECFIFSGNLCAKIDYAPGTKNDKILKGPMSIFKMFFFLKGTVFETGVDAAFESSTKDEAYLFKGNQYALINYSDDEPKLFHITDIGEGYPSLKGTIFDKGIDAAFASHRWNEAYIFKGDTYALINFAPASTKDYIVNGPKKIFPNWPSLKSILPRPNDGLDVHDHAIEVPDGDHDEL